MASEWYYQIMGQQFGPVSAAELRALASAGTVARDTLICKRGEGRWVRAEKVQGLFERNDSRPAPAVPVSEKKSANSAAASSTEKELRAPTSPPPLPLPQANEQPDSQPVFNWTEVISKPRFWLCVAISLATGVAFVGVMCAVANWIWGDVPASKTGAYGQLFSEFTAFGFFGVALAAFGVAAQVFHLDD